MRRRPCPDNGGMLRVPRVVLDTNALMDWLVFAHPACSAWDDWLASGRAEWVATQAMQDEWRHVRARGVGAEWRPAGPRDDDAWSVHATLVPSLPPPLATPRCTDPDDQKFIDCALTSGARWLVTRDRALLKLRRPLARRGVAVLTPEQWVPPLPGSTVALA
jgi:uncharacterized protein